MKIENNYEILSKDKSRYLYAVYILILASLFIPNLYPIVGADPFLYPIFGYATSCDDTLAYQSAYVTVTNTQTGAVYYDTTEQDGYYGVTFSNMGDTLEWKDGDTLIVWINGTGAYTGWTGKQVTVFDESLVPHQINITLCNDTTPPKTTFSLTGLRGCNEWYTSNVTVTLTASDNDSGVSHTKYQLDNDILINYSEPFTITSEGPHNISYYSIDKAGNNETPKNMMTQIDKSIPQTTVSLIPQLPNGNNGWHTSDVNILFYSEDEISGINETWYKINNEDWQKYTGPSTIEDDGEYKLEYYSTDNACNAESIQSTEIKIDTVKPSISLKKPVENRLYIFDRELIHLPSRTIIIGKVTIEVDVTDATSGIDKVLFYVDDDPKYTDTIDPYEYVYDTKSFLLRPHTIKVNVIDNAGNTKETSELGFWYFNMKLSSLAYYISP